MESLFTVIVVDAHEGRDVIVFNVPGACLNYDMPELTFIIVKIGGEYVNIMCKVNPEHRKSFRKEMA